jgi:myo-inositol-1(or 4)-monophosphatase
MLDFFVSININIWDMAAASLILSEAGGKVSEMNGVDLTSLSKTIVATNGKLHQELLDTLK